MVTTQCITAKKKKQKNTPTKSPQQKHAKKPQLISLETTPLKEISKHKDERL